MKRASSFSRYTLGGAALISAIVGASVTYAILGHLKQQQREADLKQTRQAAKSAQDEALRSSNRAHRAREQAEALVEFILDDLRTALIPLGRTELLSTAAERAARYFENLPPDQVTPETRFHLAKVLVTIGQSLTDQGDLEKADQHFLRSLQLLEELTSSQPERLNWQFEFAWSLSEHGIVLTKLDDFASVRAVNEKALSLFQSLVRNEFTHEDAIDWHYGVAAAHYGLATAAAGMRERESALTSYQHCIDAAEATLQRDPDHLLTLQVLAIAHNDLGLLHLRQENHAAAIPALERGVAAIQRLQAQDPQNRRWQKELATSLNNIGTSLDAMGRHEEAEAILREALDLRLDLVAWDPRNGEWRANLANSWHNLASLYFKTGRDEQALAAVAGSLKHYHTLTRQEPDNSSWRAQCERSHESLSRQLQDHGKHATNRRFHRFVMEQGRALHETEPRLLPWEEHLVALHPSWLEAEAASGHDTPSTRWAITQSIAELRALGAEATPESETARQRLGHALSQFAKVAQENSDRVGSLRLHALAHHLLQRPHASYAHEAAFHHASALRPDTPITWILPADATWRYHYGADAAEASWTQPRFDDEAWPQGQAPLGYGEGDEATELDYGTDASRKPLTAYFRHTFALPADLDPQAPLQLGLVCDDGAIVYLNGQEIARCRMAEGPATASTVASETAREPDESAYSYFSFAASVLPLTRDGNVIAVEVHQNEPVSSDLRFALRMHTEIPLPQPLEGFDASEALEAAWLRDCLPSWLREELQEATTPGRP